MQEKEINRGWGGFALKFTVAIVYYAVCTAAGLYLTYTTEVNLAYTIGSAALILAPLLIWMAVAAARRRRADEYERQLTDRSLAWAAQWAVVFIVLMNVIHLFIPIINAPGVFALPGLYAVAFVLMRQAIKFRRIGQ